MDRTLGVAAHRLGLLIMLAALVWGATLLVRRGRTGDDMPPIARLTD
jgi:hypothetical protein